MPARVEIANHEICHALREPIFAVVNVVKKTVLEHTEPELAADLFERGLCLAGGGALLRGLPELLSRETGLPVRVAEDPLTCVARSRLRRTPGRPRHLQADPRYRWRLTECWNAVLFSILLSRIDFEVSSHGDCHRTPWR